jgi:hypothetical protein
MRPTTDLTGRCHHARQSLWEGPSRAAEKNHSSTEDRSRTERSFRRRELEERGNSTGRPKGTRFQTTGANMNRRDEARSWERRPRLNKTGEAEVEICYDRKSRSKTRTRAEKAKNRKQRPGRGKPEKEN